MESVLTKTSSFDAEISWKIPAIKVVRHIFNMGLKEAKDAVESAQRNGRIVIRDNIVVSKTELAEDCYTLKGLGFILDFSDGTMAILDNLKKAATFAIEENKFQVARSILNIADKVSMW